MCNESYNYTYVYISDFVLADAVQIEPRVNFMHAAAFLRNFIFQSSAKFDFGIEVVKVYKFILISICQKN